MGSTEDVTFLLHHGDITRDQQKLKELTSEDLLPIYNKTSIVDNDLSEFILDQKFYGSRQLRHNEGIS